MHLIQMIKVSGALLLKYVFEDDEAVPQFEL